MHIRSGSGARFALSLVFAQAVALTMVSAAMAQPGGPAPGSSAPRPNADLIKLGESLLDNPGAKPKANVGAKPKIDAGAGDAAPDANAADAANDAEGVVDAEVPGAASATPLSSDAESPAPPQQPETAASTPRPPPPPPAEATKLLSPAAKARVDSGKNLPLKAVEDSPIAKLGVPIQAVPAVATVVAAGGMLVWPLLIKTIMGILKGIFAGFLKNRAKKKQKVDKAQRTFIVMGARIRPIELGQLVLGAAIYALAICYTFKGWKMDAAFVAGQEALVISIALVRMAIRIGFERKYNLTTQYRFWAGGAFLCLGSAYLGNTISTVGFELEDAKTPEEATRAVRLKVVLIWVALGMATVFCVLNIMSPGRLWQAGRVTTLGAALAEILPIAPMAGFKIFKWRWQNWLPLLVIVALAFISMNFVL